MKSGIIAAVLLTGCVAYVPADSVLFASSDRIKIQWDEWRTTEDAVRAKANQHCGGPVELIDAGQDGAYRWRTWRCVAASR